MAREAAITLAQRYSYDKIVDTVVCMDGSEVIGAFLARQLASNNRFNLNSDKNIDVITPEYDSNGQLIFRSNLTPMVNGKDILLLISTVNSGITVGRVLDCVRYYGGTVQGIAAIFSTQEEVAGIPVFSLYTQEDIPGYFTSESKECPMCKAGQRIDALSNSYGFSPL
jgi:orotate phosphoribosyltransferase